MLKLPLTIIYAPREQRDANEYSEMLGTFTERSRSVSRSNAIFGGRGGSSESFSEQRRPLLLPQELKELGRDREIVLLENTKPILAERICYWRDPEFTSRLMVPPQIPAIDLVRFTAQVERRVRALEPDEVDADSMGLIHVSPEYLEVLQAWDPRDLPRYLADISDDDAAAYVERHFRLIGVPADKVVLAARRIPLSVLDSADISPPVVPARKGAPGQSGTTRGRCGSRRSTRTADGSNVVPLHGDNR